MADLSCSSSVLTIGNFDGLHIGHQKILEKLVQIARGKSLPSYIVTFEPNPKIFFGKENALLQTPAQRLSSLRNSGVDGIFVVDFDKAHILSGEDFVRSFLIERFKMKHLVVGENFRLGKNRSYDINMLCDNLTKLNAECTVVQQMFLGDKPVSSSRIRDALRIGEVETAAVMLGKPYSIEGVVVRGDGFGTRMIGYPTINIDTENMLLPQGVFITQTAFPGSEKKIWGITNVGIRPTLSGTQERIETHLLHFQGSLYGRDVALSFKKRIRSEVRFETTRQLSEQIAKDVETLKSYLRSPEISES